MSRGGGWGEGTSYSPYLARTIFTCLDKLSRPLKCLESMSLVSNKKVMIHLKNIPYFYSISTDIKSLGLSLDFSSSNVSVRSSTLSTCFVLVFHSCLDPVLLSSFLPHREVLSPTFCFDWQRDRAMPEYLFGSITCRKSVYWGSSLSLLILMQNPVACPSKAHRPSPYVATIAVISLFCPSVFPVLPSPCGPWDWTAYVWRAGFS